MRVWTAVLLLFCSIALLAWTESGTRESATPTQTLGKSPAMVIGFVGGFVKHDDVTHVEVELADRLRKSYPAGTYVRVFENHHRDEAHRQILRLLNTDRDPALTAEERQRARIIIFGHSWGGSETVTLARQLGKEGIPVLLTVQVDSVSKPGQKDGVVPPNVAQAINFYQTNGLVHGRSEIRAANPARTRILGNVRMDYEGHTLTCTPPTRLGRLFMKTHLEIECDPAVWSQVEALIRSQLAPLVATEPVQE
jgi:hypothetical protein